MNLAEMKNEQARPSKAGQDQVNLSLYLFSRKQLHKQFSSEIFQMNESLSLPLVVIENVEEEEKVI